MKHLQTFLWLLATLLTAISIAQEPTFHGQSNIVLVPALVKDGSGNTVFGLKADDFIVEDDGVAQQIRMDEMADSEPLSLVIAIQRGRTAKLEAERTRTLSALLDPILGSGHAEVALVAFDSRVEPVQEFTPDGDLIASQLRDLKHGDEGAAILDAVSYSLGLLEQTPERHRRALLLISETRDHGSKTKIDEAVTAIGRSNTLVFTLAFSPSLSNVLDDLRGKSKQESDHVDIGVLATRLAILARQGMKMNVPKTLAWMTGGEYELFKSHKGFESRMTEFSNHLYVRYELSFQPVEPHPGLHQLQVKLKDGKKGSVLARSTYWAAAKPQ
ncbi:MAG TPA: VWA domain-containing protein [Candidatus Angelobacter sp.]